MRQYLDLLQEILEGGEVRDDRTGVGVRSLFARSLQFDLHKGFPLLTTKKIHIKSVVEELLWFISGSSNVRDLQAKGVSIWDEWADETTGELGPVYGKQWRAWQASNGETIDQLKNLIYQLKENPFSRRHIICSWNVGSLDKMALPPCHCLYQFYIGSNKLSCQMYQRSADIFLGVPFNIASYALLTHLLAHVLDLEVGSLSIVFGDVHLYSNHFEQAKLQLSREPKQLPRVELDSAVTDLFDFKSEHIKFIDYEPYPKITAPIAV